MTHDDLPVIDAGVATTVTLASEECGWGPTHTAIAHLVEACEGFAGEVNGMPVWLLGMASAPDGRPAIKVAAFLEEDLEAASFEPVPAGLVPLETVERLVVY